LFDQLKKVTHSEPDQAATAPQHSRGQRLAATGGIIGAVAASSCCLLPLLLAVLGVGGAWMSGLRALAPYQPYFVGLAVIAIGYGLYQSYWKPREACGEGEACAAPAPNGLARSGLWLATAIVAVVISLPYWFPLAEPYLP
jgi:mercuric ion transport protein